jgi:hypothetical protein
MSDIMLFWTSQYLPKTFTPFSHLPVKMKTSRVQFLIDSKRPARTIQGQPDRVWVRAGDGLIDVGSTEGAEARPRHVRPDPMHSG